jgi:hypothetical protein
VLNPTPITLDGKWRNPWKIKQRCEEETNTYVDFLTLVLETWGEERLSTWGLDFPGNVKDQEEESKDWLPFW